MGEVEGWFGDGASVERSVAVFLLVAARIAPLAWLAPWLVLRTFPLGIRFGIMLAVTVALAPMAAHASAPSPLPSEWLPLFALRELVVGLVFAIASALPFHGFLWAGELVDRLRGAQLPETREPLTADASSPLGELYLLTGIATFAALGGHRAALTAFADGLVAVPIGAVALESHLGAIVGGAARLTGSALFFALAVALPAAAALILVELTFGVLARVMPFFPSAPLSLPVRAAVGLLAVLLGLSAALGGFPSAVDDALGAAAAWMRAIGKTSP